jgi:hypothetical protein
VDRVSTDVAALLDHRAADVVGQSLFRPRRYRRCAPLLKALARSSETGLGTSLAVRPQLFGFVRAAARLMLLPMEPSPSFRFALMSDDAADALTSALAMSRRCGSSTRRAVGHGVTDGSDLA